MTASVLTPVAGPQAVYRVNPVAKFAATFVLAIVLRLDPFWVKAGVLYAALPIAANVFVISERFETDRRPLAAAIVISTTAAALTFPIAIGLVSG